MDAVDRLMPSLSTLTRLARYYSLCWAIAAHALPGFEHAPSNALRPSLRFFSARDGLHLGNALDHTRPRRSHLLTFHDWEDGMALEREPRTEWTVESVRGLGLTTTVGTAASILGISRTKAYALAKEGAFPVTLVRVGRRYLVPTTPLLDLLTGGRAAVTKEGTL